MAYVATGVWHYFLSTGDRGFLEELLPVVHNAVEFVCDAQTPRGEIHWARHADGKFWPFALLTGSSSISHSFECALKLAAAVGEERPRWQEAQDRLRPVIAKVPEAFAPKKRWAMDWYYPVLSGALTGQEARKRLREGWEKFVMEGKGVRCVADKEWVTAAETAECAIAHFIAGETETAKELLGWTNHLRASDNRYWTGMAYPDRVHFPAEEKTTYTAAAVILAADVIGADGDVAEADDLGQHQQRHQQRQKEHRLAGRHNSSNLAAALSTALPLLATISPATGSPQETSAALEHCSPLLAALLGTASLLCETVSAEQIAFAENLTRRVPSQ